MAISDLDFFHQATLRICSSLDIEKVISACFDYLRDHIPLDLVMVNIFDEDANNIKNVTIAPPIDTAGSVPPIEVQKEMAREIANTKQKILVEPYADKHPIGRAFKSYIGAERYSGLVLRLVIDDKILGVLALLAFGNNRFNKEHARLAAMLHDPMCLALSNTLKHQEILKLKEILVDDNLYLKKEISQMRGEEIIGANYGLRDVMEMVSQVSPLSSHVLILGETGTGKEVIANSIHFSSRRKNNPFIKVNCGAIPDSLVDSELFGHEKGAFTGAISQKRGRFERAHEGTIFLDEIAELPQQAQVRLLRVIQNREIERVGGDKSIPVDVRIIAATHRNLEEMVRRGEFREDLWFRLNVFPIMIPPLRMRKSDIPALVHYFMERKARELNLGHHPAIIAESMKLLQDYHWPGNVRELENLVERVLIKNRTTTDLPLSFDDLIPRKTAAPKKESSEIPFPELPLNLDEANRRIIQTALDRTKGRVQGKKGAATLLGINPNTLRNRMKKLGIQYGRKIKAQASNPD